MSEEAQPQTTAPHWVDPPPGEGGVTTETAPRHMKFVRVAKSELEDLKSSNSTLELGFFGISFGALITLVATLRTVTITDAATHAAFVAGALVFGLAAAYFGIATIRGERRWRRRIDALKSGKDS